MRKAAAVVLGVILITAGRASGQPQPSPMPDLPTCDSDCPPPVSQAIGSYGPTTLPTAGATVDYATLALGWHQAGTSVRIGTCGMADASFTGNTLLRLFIAGTTTEVASNNDSCAGAGSQINYVAPYDMYLELHAGCAGNTLGCGGTIAKSTRLDATPRPANVKAAFQRVHNQGVLSKSPDLSTLMRGMYYQGDGWGEKYHHQGISRTYNRARYDIVWTNSVHAGAAPEYRNTFFTRMGSKPAISRAQRFGSNLGLGEGTVYDAVIFGSNAGVYDAYHPGDDDTAPQAADWDGVPPGRKFDHAGGIQAIGNYVATASEFVSLPCLPNPWNPGFCPDHRDRNIPASGQASQVVLYDISQPQPQPKLLISRKNQGSGWVAIAKLREAQAPPVLRNGYLVMVPDGNELSLYAITADPCTGYASLGHTRAYLATTYGTPPTLDPLSPPTCPGVRTAGEQMLADLRQVSYVGCVKRTSQGPYESDDPDCPNLVSMYEDGEEVNFPPQEDVQSANFVTQANGRLFLLAFEGQQVEDGPNSEVQLWRVVFGAASGAGATLRTLPDGRECETFLCLVRAGTDDARDSYKNMNVTGINGSMFRFGGGGYIVPSANPASETLFVYGTEHYLQKTPRAALFNEF
jgi:hypothetical protein